MRFFSLASAEWTKVSFERRSCCSQPVHNALQCLWEPSVPDTVSTHAPPSGLSTLARGLGNRTLRRKIPCVHSVPLNVGSKLVLIDKQPNKEIVHALRLGKTNGATHQPLDPRA